MINIKQWQRIWINVNLATMDEQNTQIENGAIAVANGKIVWLGKMAVLKNANLQHVEVIDGKNQWLTPGLIDCHTHLVYGGNRAKEFELRLQGASYEEIALSGGGIVSTVAATRNASEASLFNSALKRLSALHQQGVTTVEIKSGYGLNTESEIKMLKVADKLANALPISVRKTFLGAHALPPEYKGDAQGYIDMLCQQTLPQIAEQHLADAVDVFCENIGFNLAHTEQIFTCANKYNLPVKVHAEQLSNMGATKLAAKFHALSSDHLEFLDESGIKAMAEAQMTAVLLPGAFYFLREKQLPPIDLLRKHQVDIAIATDANPGSSPLNSIQLMLNMACTLFRLTPTEALHGVTRHAAKALGLSEQVGSLQLGLRADFALWDIEQLAELCYQFGVNPLTQLVKSGNRVI